MGLSGGTALREIAANRAKPLHGRRAVDALGRAVYSQHLHGLRDRHDHRLGEFILQCDGAETRVDLDQPQCSRTQQRHDRGVERKVIDDDAAAELLAQIEEALYLSTALNTHGFGDLEADALSGDAVCTQVAREELREALVLE